MKKFLFLAPTLAAAVAAGTPRRFGPTGTYDLEYLKSITTTTVINFGLDAVQAAIQAELAAHNAQMMDMISTLAAPVSDRVGPDATGNALTGEMEEVDEYGRVRTQMLDRPGMVAFPMRRYQFGNGFTAEFLRKATPAQIALAVENAEAAHRRAVIRALRDRLFCPTNYDFYDFMKDNYKLGVKGLYNADGTVPPSGPNLESFDGTHSHFFASNQLDDNLLSALILTVAEHDANAAVEVDINIGQEAAIRALPGFAPAIDQEIRVNMMTPSTPVAVAPLGRNINNRFIGRYRSASIYVKPWVPANYLDAVNTAAAVPPLGFRQDTEDGETGLRPIGQIITFPLQSEYFGAEFGVGVRNRGAAAAAYIGGTTYVDPTKLGR